MASGSNRIRFSPASRIILIESNGVEFGNSYLSKFQSRKQDYFNWKLTESEKLDY